MKKTPVIHLPRAPVPVTSYRTSDDMLHASPALACSRQQQLDLRELLERLGVGRGGEWDADMIADVLLDHWREFRDIMGTEPEEQV